MNKKVIFVLILTGIALGMLALFSFGSSQSNKLLMRHKLTKPVGIKIKDKVNDVMSWDLYRNRDLKENYYSVRLPDVWSVSSDRKPGSYRLNFSEGSGTISLMDVPDNCTLELFILSEEEPQFRKTMSGYQRIDYKKFTVAGNEAYLLTYKTLKGDKTYETLKAYISGPDQTGVLTLVLNQSASKQTFSLVNSIIQKFKWENS